MHPACLWRGYGGLRLSSSSPDPRCPINLCLVALLLPACAAAAGSTAVADAADLSVAQFGILVKLFPFLSLWTTEGRYKQELLYSAICCCCAEPSS